RLPAALLPPARDRRADARDPRPLEVRPCNLEQLERGGARPGVGPPDDRLARLDRQRALDLGAQLVGRDDHELRAAGPAHTLVDLAADRLQVLGDELLDVPL